MQWRPLFSQVIGNDTKPPDGCDAESLMFILRTEASERWKLFDVGEIGALCILCPLL